MNSIVKGELLQINENVKQYYSAGLVQFDRVLKIPMVARIPNLTHLYGLETIHKLITAMLTAFNNSLNLIRPMTPEQVTECALELVMTTEEDQLSIEDYVLFFKGAKTGKYGRILDRLDQQTIFTMLEEYRSERHRQYIRIKETLHLERKGLGPGERQERDELAEQFCNIAGRLGEMKEKLKEQKEINRAARL